MPQVALESGYRVTCGILGGMKNLLLVGIVLMIVGGALMVFDVYTHREKHEANVFGMKLSVTENEPRRVPRLVSGTILAVGAAVTVIGALKRKSA
jgi:hypothetical protein